MKLCHIQALINAAGDRLNFSNQLILNVLQVVAVIWSYQIDGQAQVSKTPWERMCIVKGLCTVSSRVSKWRECQILESVAKTNPIVVSVICDLHLICQCGAGMSLHFWGSQNWWPHLLPGCQFLEWIGLQESMHISQPAIFHFMKKRKTVFTYLCRPGFCTIHSWSHETHGSCIPASSLHECRSTSSPAGWFSWPEAQPSGWSYKRWLTDWSEAVIETYRFIYHCIIIHIIVCNSLVLRL